jgi:hypothetical protein
VINAAFSVQIRTNQMKAINVERAVRDLKHQNPSMKIIEKYALILPIPIQMSTATVMKKWL